MSEAQDVEKKYKRKRKKNFMVNARKYAKKGCYGRGSQLEEDTYQYFVRILEAYRAGFDSDEEKRIFVNNVFDQTDGQEVIVCSNQLGCRVIEMLLPFAGPAVLRRFMDVIGAELRTLCVHRFASFVLQTLLQIACTRSLEQRDDDEESKENLLRNDCGKFTEKMAKFVLNNLEDFVFDPCGSHIIRTVCINLAQIPKPVESKNDNSMKAAKQVDASANLLETSAEYKLILTDYGERLCAWPQFKEFPNSDLTSGMVQVLVRALAKCNRKLHKKYISKTMDECFLANIKNSNDELPSVFLSKSAIILLEECIQTAGDKSFAKIYEKLFKGRLIKLATLRDTNFSVQKLFARCSDKAQLESIVDELIPDFTKILETGYSGVLWNLAEACKRLSTRQGQLVQNLMKCLGCLEPDERQNSLVVCLCKLSQYENVKFEDDLESTKLNLHGTLIAQAILHFNKPIKLVNSIMNLDRNKLRELFMNQKGCHVADAFMTSAFVGEKSREKLIKNLQGSYDSLANSKFGSRSFDAIWRAAIEKNKCLIIEELSYKAGLWSNGEYGKHIAQSVNFNLYKRNKNEWMSSLHEKNSTPKEIPPQKKKEKSKT